MKPQFDYINDVLDEEYLIIPSDEVAEGSLPQEDIEVSRALSSLKMLYLKANDLSFLSRLFKTKDYLEWEAAFNLHKEQTKKLILTSNVHRAAYHRIVNSIPKDTKDYDKAFWELLKHIEKAQ